MRGAAAPKASGAPKASTRGRVAPAPAAAPDERAPLVERVGRVEVVSYPGPLPRPGEGPLTRAELDFRWLIAGELVGDRVEVRPEFHEWSESVRLAWEWENVVWCHGYANGKPIWRRERPPTEVEPPPRAGKSNEVARCKRAHTQEEG